MSSKIKTIIISVVIIAVIILAYFLFFQKAPDKGNLTSTGESTPTPASQSTGATVTNAPVDPDFLAMLLSVKSLTLNDSIFSSQAFASLRDSSIILTPDNTTEGRVNPFAPIGSDTTSIPVSPDLSSVGLSSQTNGTVNNTTSNQTGTPKTPKKN